VVWSHGVCAAMVQPIRYISFDKHMPGMSGYLRDTGCGGRLGIWRDPVHDRWKCFGVYIIEVGNLEVKKFEVKNLKVKRNNCYYGAIKEKTGK
jgi:hypothetical protein